MALGTLALRLTIGGVLAGHGLQKLGAFGGPGISGVVPVTRSLGLHPAEVNAQAITWTETAGGAAFALGAGTPLAAAALIASQAVALRKVHLPKGFWASQGGFEYNLAIIAALFATLVEGPGAISLDAIIGKRKWGVGIGLAALIGGIAASFVVTEAGKRLAPPADAEPADAEQPPTDPS